MRKEKRREKKEDRFKVILWNLAGIHKVWNVWDLLEKYDVIILQETWLEKSKEKELLNKLNRNYVWVAKAADRVKDRGRAKGGTIIGVHEKIAKNVEIEEGKNTLNVKNLKIGKEERLNIITCYNNKGVSEIISELEKKVQEGVEEGKRVLVMGDFNARIGDLQIEREGGIKKRKSKDKRVNGEGKKIVNFCEELGLTIRNGETKGDEEGSITYVGEGEGSVLDLVLELETEKESLIEELNVIYRIESDHLPVSLEIKREGLDEMGIEEEQIDLKAQGLKWRGGKTVEYKEKIRKEEGKKENEGNNAQEKWEKMRMVINKAAEELKLVTRGGRGVKKGGIENDREVKEQKIQVMKALKRWVKSGEEEDKKGLKEERKKLRKIKEDKKREKREEEWERVENSKGMQEFWEAMDRFRAKRKSKGMNIKKVQWLEHFRNLLGKEGEKVEVGEEARKETQRTNDEELDREIEIGELKLALGRMKNNKAAGEDGLTIEFIKALTEGWMEELREILNELLNEGKLIEGWEVARIYPIFKVGDEEDTANYRGVSLLDVGYKILTNIIATRIRGWLEKNKLIKESQAGFRGKRGTRDHIFVLNSIIGNKIKRKGGKLYGALIDFKTAFDSVNREKLFEKLEKIGIKGKVLGIIKGIYRETKNEVITGEGITESFNTNKGVRQGCPLSPSLFNIFIEDLEEQWVKRNEGGTVIGGTKIFCMKFADDVVILADTKEGLQDMLRELEKYCRRNELVVNTKKTKVMVWKNKGKRSKEEKWYYGGEELEIVKEYKYLGFWVTSTNSLGLHLRKMGSKTRKTINMIWGMWKRANIGKLSRRIYLAETIARSSCMYGVEIWGWKRREEIERVQNRYVKMAMGVRSNTPNYIVRMEAGMNSLEMVARKRASSYILEVINMGRERWPNICLREELRGVINGNPSVWGKELREAFQEVGDGIGIRLLAENKSREEIGKRLEENIKIKLEQEIQEDWGRIDRSKYCKNYKDWKVEIGREKYWESNRWNGFVKQQWAKMRCGSVGREESKGFKNSACRICGREEERLEHVWVCEKAKEEIKLKKRGLVEEIEAEGLIGSEREVTDRLKNILRGEIRESLCMYIHEFEKIAGKGTEKE